MLYDIQLEIVTEHRNKIDKKKMRNTSPTFANFWHLFIHVTLLTHSGNGSALKEKTGDNPTPSQQ